MKAVQLAGLGLILIAGPACAQSVRGYDIAGPLAHCDGYNKGSGADRSIFIAYVWGYVSAAAIYSGRDNLREVDGNETKPYIERYCKAHPENTTKKVADDLFESGAGRN